MACNSSVYCRETKMYEASLSGVFRLYRAALSRCWIPALVLALGGVVVAVAFERMLPAATGDIWQWSAEVRSVMLSGSLWRMLLRVPLRFLLSGA